MKPILPVSCTIIIACLTLASMMYIFTMFRETANAAGETYFDIFHAELLQGAGSFYEPLSVEENIQRFCSDSKEKQNICGVTGPKSWQCLYATLHREIVMGERSFTAVVYECHKSMYCGGLGDRLRGLANMFYLSVLTGKGVFINITKPTKLNHVLLPRGIAWDVDLIYKEEVHALKRSFFVETYREEYDKVGRLDYIGDSPGFWKARTKNWALPFARMTTSATLRNGMNAFLQKFGHIEGPTTTHKQEVAEALGTMKPNSVSVMIGCAINFLFQPSKLTNNLMTHVVVQDLLEINMLNLNQDEVAMAATFENYKTPRMLEGIGRIFNLPPERDLLKRASLTNFLTDKVLQTDGLNLSYVDRDLRNGMLSTFPNGMKLMGVHFRMRGWGGFGGAFYDGVAMHQLTDLEELFECAFTFASWLGWEPDKFKIFFASDNMDARIRAKSLHPDRIILKSMMSGQTLHVDYMNVTDKLGLKMADTLMEPIMLSLADALIVSRSGFSLTAMSIGFYTKQNVMHFGAKGAKNKCDINAVYGSGQKYS